MTSFAMIVGMIPVSLGMGDGGKQTAPLGIAVIGGLLFSIFMSLWLLPLVYDLVMGKKRPRNVSLDPNDENSIYYDKNI
jgi:multidrug efflux pump subunit AcrB